MNAPLLLVVNFIKDYSIQEQQLLTCSVSIYKCTHTDDKVTIKVHTRNLVKDTNNDILTSSLGLDLPQRSRKHDSNA